MARKPPPIKKPQVTKEQCERVLGAMRAGLSFHKACKVNGLSHATMGRERKRNPDFDTEVLKAQNSLELHCLVTIRKASGKQWQAAAWLLERCYGDRYKLNYKPQVAPTVIRFEGDPDAALPKVHPMRASDADGEAE